MEKHQFKVIYLSDEDVYRIIDLTDTSLVGRIEMFDDFFDDEREQRKQYYKDIKGKQRVGAKVAGYGVFIFVDEDNSPERPSDEDYVRRVLNQMASFFKEEVISKQPNKFKDYIVSKNRQPKPEKNGWRKWFKGWRLALIITCVVLLIGVIVCSIVFPSVWKVVSNIIAIILGFPILVVMFIAFADDMFARR